MNGSYLSFCRESFLGKRREELRKRCREQADRLDALLEACGEREKSYLYYVLASLPLSDLALCPPELFLHTVREALTAREEFFWYPGESPDAEGVEEGRFLMYVLCPRVFDEELSDCRGLFRKELTPRVKGLPLEEAVLEVNRWCAEHVTYRSTDDYTDSALRVYRQGYGRCGEESAFAVNALRSVGIAARQVYAPWWSHCDDNHAWVEAFCGETGWNYLGACEPEPVLNRGWFTSAANRAMVLHSHSFAAGDKKSWGPLFPLDDSLRDARLGEEDGVICEVLPQKHSRMAEVLATDDSGLPVPGARVKFQVLNMADFRTVSVRKTGQDGKAFLELSLSGSVLISGEKNGLYGETLVRVSDSTPFRVPLTLVPQRTVPGPESHDFDFHAVESAFAPPLEPLTGEQKRSRREVLDRCAALRERRAGEPVPPRKFGALPLAGREALAPKNGLWPLERPARGDCALTLSAPKDREALWGKDFSLSLFCGQKGYCPIQLEDLPAGGKKTFSLPNGRYRLITALRLPNGDQLARRWDFSLESGASQETALSFRQAKPEDLLRQIPLPAFSLRNGKGEAESGLPAGSSFSLLVWLEPGREPTEHILNELMEQADALRGTGCGIRLILESSDQENNFTLRSALKRLPEAQVLYQDFADSFPALARAVYADPDKLPLVLLADHNGNCLYSSSGYNVGTGALLVRLLEELQN